MIETNCPQKINKSPNGDIVGGGTWRKGCLVFCPQRQSCFDLFLLWGREASVPLFVLVWESKIENLTF